jgi:hypothetical protein
MLNTIREIVDTDDYTVCNDYLKKGWYLLFIAQNVEEDYFDVPKVYPTFILGRPADIS